MEREEKKEVEGRAMNVERDEKRGQCPCRLWFMGERGEVNLGRRER